MVKQKHILVGISGSFCNHHAVIEQLQKLAQQNHLTFVLSEHVYHSSTRFYENEEFLSIIKHLSPDPIIHSITEAEKIGPQNCYDAMLTVPCTATQCGKLVHGIYDDPLTLAMKAMIRNQKPVVIGFASNDGLGISGANFFSLFMMRHLYMLPIAQDAPQTKPLSVVACWECMEDTLEQALLGKQIQPVLKEGKQNGTI